MGLVPARPGRDDAVMNDASDPELASLRGGLTARRLSGVLPILVGVLSALIVLWWTLAPPSRAWCETWYARGLYPLLARCLVPVADAVPWLLGPPLLVLALAGAAAFRIVRSRRRRADGPRPSRRRRLVRAGATLAMVVAFIWALFLLTWGANYRREGVEKLLRLDSRPVAEEDLRGLVDLLVETIRREAGPAAREGRDTERALLAARDALADLLEEVQSVRPRLPRRVKRLPRGLLYRFSTTGVFLAPLMEACVDGAAPPATFVAVGAHELAHAGGVAGEADADVLSALAGIRSRDAFARYSAALWAFRRSAGALDAAQRAQVESRLPDVARADIEAAHSAARRYHRPAFSALQRRVYDAYLRSQGVDEGIRDYSRAVELLVRARRAGWLDGGEG